MRWSEISHKLRDDRGVIDSSHYLAGFDAEAMAPTERKSLSSFPFDALFHNICDGKNMTH